MSVIESLKIKNTLSNEEYKNKLMKLNIQLFASSGTLGVLSGSYKTAYTVSWSLRSQDIATNKSKIRLYGTLTTGNTTYIGSLYNADEFTIEGTKVHGGWEKSGGTSGTVTVWQEYIDIEVQHNDDGTFPTRKVSFSAYDHVAFTTKQNGSGYIYAYDETNHPEGVPTIPRASSVSCSSPYIGDNAVITIGKKATAFANTVTYEIGAIKGTIAEKTSETVLQLDTASLKEEIYALMPNDKKISGTITCTTFSGDAQIGEPTTATFNLYAVEEDCKPKVTGEVVDTNPDTIDLTGDSLIIVKNVSKPKVTITATPQLGSTIKSYSINLNDGQISALQEDIFDTINSNKITVNATDSRGYSNPYDIDLTDRVIDYVKLHFNSVELSRPEGTSNEVILDCDGIWFNGDFSESTPNTLTVNFLYRISGETEWIDGGEITPTIDDNKFSFNNYSLGNLFDYNEEYQIKIIATDLLMTVGNSNKEAIPVPKGQEVWFECEDGIGAYGHIWLNDVEVPIAKNEQNDSKIDTYSCSYVNEKIKNIANGILVESGSNENGSWVKFEDGTMICRCTKSYSIKTPNSTGPLYYGYRTLDDFPQPFKERPDITYSFFDGADTIALQPYSLDSNDALSETSAGAVFPITINKHTTAFYIHIGYIAIGKWK